MAMVANNPAAAKRLGIPQSVGKEFMKADKRKAKKFDLGGPTSYSGEDTGEGMKMSARRGGDSGMSFKQAFAAARKAGDSTFTWQGKKYTTEMAGAKKAEPAKVVETKTETKVEAPRVAAAPAAPVRAPSAVRGRGAPGTREIDRQYARNRRESYLDRITPSFGGLSDMFGLRREEELMKRMGVDRAEARSRLANLERVKESEGMKRGGKVKKYAGGGSVSSASKRADGIASKGKTRGKFV